MSTRSVEPSAADEPLFECVPNFSEGRDPAVLEALVEAAASVAHVRLLDHSMDADHNRAVVTFAGPRPAVAEAAFRVTAEATRRIDLRRHAGVHPRMGATDVLPFVPLSRADAEAAVTVAHAVGQRIGDELGVPVYYYGAAALHPSRRALPDVRRGGYEGLLVSIPHDPDRRPDAGPTDGPHPTAGATAVGVRPFLIAFNVDLESRDLALARKVAASVREAGGGPPGIRALGLLLETRGVVQISMNVTDYERAGLVEAFDAVERAARALGAAVRSSELIGLAPAAALDAGIAERVRLRGFDPERHVLEARLAAHARTDGETPHPPLVPRSPEGPLR